MNQKASNSIVYFIKKEKETKKRNIFRSNNYENISVILIFPIIIFFLFSSSCSSPVHLIQKGDSAKAVQVLVKRLIRNPNHEKSIQSLKQAYQIANQKDNDKIKSLKISGQPDIWYDVYLHYSDLQKRQQLVKTLSPEILTKIGFEQKNYDNDIVQAKQKAAKYLYAHAKMLLEKNELESARQAYSELEKVKGLFVDYKDTDALMRQAIIIGTNYVLFKVENNTYMPFPPPLDNILSNISLSELDKRFVNYDTRRVVGRKYDYVIQLEIQNISVSPEHDDKNHYTETKKVQDGWEYVHDKNGNIVKDSTGKAIEVPKYKTISCYVTEIHQSKSANISGYLNYINEHNKQIINSTPISAKSVFHHVSVICNGDMEACSPETLSLVGTNVVPFPANIEMIMDAGRKLKEVVKNTIWSDNYLIE